MEPIPEDEELGASGGGSKDRLPRPMRGTNDRPRGRVGETGSLFGLRRALHESVASHALGPSSAVGMRPPMNPPGAPVFRPSAAADGFEHGRNVHLSGGPDEVVGSFGTQDVWDPISWNTCFESRFEIALGRETIASEPEEGTSDAAAIKVTWKASEGAAAETLDKFVVYTAGGVDGSRVETVAVLLHGGGHSALSWAPVARALLSSRKQGRGGAEMAEAHEELSEDNASLELQQKMLVMSYDARGHGGTRCADDSDLSAAQMVRDCERVVKATLEKLQIGEKARLLVAGHSMGGAIAIKVAASRALAPQLHGVAVIDVVEGTAMSSLPYMQTFLDSRPQSFNDVHHAIRYVVNSGQVKNLDSARLSVPTQLVPVSAGSLEREPHDLKTGEQVRWRTPLAQSEQFWKGWFRGISSEFLSAPAAKLLILAGVDRFDRDLTIAQMQGKFQTLLMQGAGHAVHEDQPERTALALLEFMRRNRIIQDETNQLPFALRNLNPTPPCC